jgi:hypothetical protein
MGRKRGFSIKIFARSSVKIDPFSHTHTHSHTFIQSKCKFRAAYLSALIFPSYCLASAK